MAETAEAIPLDSLFGKVVSNLDARLRRVLQIFASEIAATDQRDAQTDTALLMMVSFAWRIAKAAGLSQAEFVAHVTHQVALSEADNV